MTADKSTTEDDYRRHRHDADRLSSPARKIFVEQLRTCTKVKSQHPCDAALWMWRPNPSKPGLDVSLEIVWLQGTVVEGYPDSVVIQDGTGKIRGQLNDVKKASKAAQGEVMFSKGTYVLLVGTILSVGEVPVIRALKCSSLNDADVHRELWQMEVLHQQLFIYR